MCNESMTWHLQSTADELKRIVTEGQISEEALHAITGISVDRVRAVLATAPVDPARLATTPPALSAEESNRLSILTAQLTDGMQIDDDERLKGILESLTIDGHLTPKNIAGLTGIDVDDLELALKDPQAVPVDKRYRLATRSSYLINAINQTRR